jgi:predicted Zn finger-like uncharacterized protein
MYTQCPACNSIFHVGAAHLSVAQGYVRCGLCDSAFNALPSLMDELTTQLNQLPNSVTEADLKKKLKSPVLRKEILLALAPVLCIGYCNIHPISYSAEPPKFIARVFQESKAAVVNVVTPGRPLVRIAPVIDTPVEAGPIDLFIADVITESDPEVVKPTQPTITFDTRPPQELLDEARTLLLKRDGPYDIAMEDLTSIILMQQPAEARTAHELLGYAYEKSKMYNKAMKEYAAYLALYPDEGEDRTRVRQRLMSLEIMNPRQQMDDISKNKTKIPRKGDNQTFSAAVSEYIYANSSESNSRLVQWHTDQIESITGIQGTWTIEHNQYTLSSRLRITEAKNLTSSRGNRTNLSSAYVDLEDTYNGWSIRGGRQFPVAGAVSKFDGLSSKISITNDLKVTVAAGTPYVGPNNTTSRKFVGAQVDYEFANGWTVGEYYNREKADGLLERSAIGTEIYYRAKETNANIRVEYDTLYHTLNLFTFQGMKYIGDYNFFAVYERRRSPMPYADIALGVGLLSPEKQVYNSVADLMTKSGLTNSEIYTYIVGSTPVATSSVLGVNKKINKDWTGTVNIQRSNLSTAPGFTVNPLFDPIPIQVGRANTTSLNLHLRGENVFVKNNTAELVVDKGFGELKSQTFTLADNYRFNANKDTASVILSLTSTNQSFGQTRGASLMLRDIHKVGEHATLEAQYSRSLSIMPVLPNQLDNSPYTTGQSFYMGFRYDF